MSQVTIEQAFQLAHEHHRAGRLLEAKEIYRQIVAAQPDHFNAIHLLGALAFQVGALQEAGELLQRAMRLNPAAAEPYYHFGCVLQAQNQFSEAITYYHLAIARNPAYAEAWNNLGNSLKELGEIPGAIAAFRKRVELDPKNWAAQSNLLLTLWYDARLSTDEIVAEHRCWNELHAAGVVSAEPFTNDKRSDRRLRIGYVSPDFRRHPVASFFEPLLANHDHAQVEVFCYSHPLHVDDVTARLRGYADHWREIAALSDEQAAALIRQDRIDALIDLAGHTAGNRLGIFARKPAPVQVSYLGYIGTTGMTATDYRVADGQTEPPGVEPWYTEKLVRLPRTFACYQPPPDAPDVGALPATRNGYITFASFNALGKITDEALGLWAAILGALPNSRFVMSAVGLQDSAAQRRIREFFTTRGIPPDRLELLGFAPMPKYLELHQRIDILLDTFPVNGHTVTCHALWMGVPVMTLAGKSYAARLGASVLTNLSLPELIATSHEDYARKALRLAANPARLTEFRETLRNKMTASPLMNVAQFARDLEEACRKMWQAWCDK
jgi:protein O-GlcNAc transferase